MARKHRRGPHSDCARERGFTLIEVMVSLGVMTIGAMAVIALQQQTIRSNIHARQMNTATQIGQLWIERLKQDAHQWNAVGYENMPPRPDGATVLAQAPLLRTVMNGEGFRGLPLSDLNEDSDKSPSDRFDVLGNELDNDSTGEHIFCVTYRTSWVYYGRAIRVDLRVFWPRQGPALPGRDKSPEAWFREKFDATCAGDNLQDTFSDPDSEAWDNLHVLYMTTVVRPTMVVR